MEILYFAHGENCFSFIYDICCKQKINVVLYKSPCFISSFYKKSPGYRDFIVTSCWFCTFLLWWMLWCYPAGGLSQRPQSVPVVVSLHVCPLWKGCTSRSLGSYPLCCTSRVTGAGIYLSWGWGAGAGGHGAYTNSTVLLSLASAAFPYTIILHINTCHKGNKLMFFGFYVVFRKSR